MFWKQNFQNKTAIYLCQATVSKLSDHFAPVIRAKAWLVNHRLMTAYGPRIYWVVVESPWTCMHVVSFPLLINTLIIPPFFASILTPNSPRFLKTSTRHAKLKEQNHLECQIKSVQFKPPSHANHAQLTKTERWLKLSRLLGKDTPSRLWLNPKPNVKVSRLLGRVTRSRLWFKFMAKCQVL